MLSAIFEKILFVFMAIGYILIYIGYGTAGINARKALGRDKWDALASLLVTAAVIFWVVRLVLWLRGTAVEAVDTALVAGMPAVYVLWCVIARGKGRRYARQAEPQKTAASTGAARQAAVSKAGGSGPDNSNSFGKGDTGKTVNFGSGVTVIRGADGTWTAVGSSKGAAETGSGSGWIPVKEEKAAPEEPLTGSFCLGSHHVTAVNAHIGMSVFYDHNSRTVIYSHWSDKEPEKKEVFPVPEHIRTKEALRSYVERETSIPSVWMY